MTQESNHKTYRLGLALSGGGAKGFAHLGVFKLLEECGLKPDIIVGTSVGALMGTLFADGYSADELKELFTGREFSEFAQLQLPKSGLFDSKRFRYFLKRHLRAKTFEELKIPMIVVATDLDNGESHEFDSGPIVEAVTASCSIPIIFSPVVINGVHYVDGGLFHIAERSYHYMFRANTLEDREMCDVLIEAEEFGMYKTFDLENVEQIARIGYDAAIRAFELVIQENKHETLVKAIMARKNNMLLP